jgi:hypothetical protein
VSLALITIELETRKKEEEKQSKRNNSNEHNCLSLLTIWLEWSLDLGEDLISCLCLWMKSRALVWGLKAEILNALKCGGWGVFIAPTTKRTAGDGFCQPRHQAVGFRPLELLTTGSPDSHYSLSGAPSGAALTSARAGAHCSLLLYRCRRPLALCSRYSAGTSDSPVLHRTVQ